MRVERYEYDFEVDHELSLGARITLIATRDDRGNSV